MLQCRFDENGNVTAAEMMNISWSADHRVLDGATLAQMSTHWKALIEQPHAMILEMR